MPRNKKPNTSNDRRGSSSVKSLTAPVKAPAIMRDVRVRRAIIFTSIFSAGLLDWRQRSGGWFAIKRPHDNSLQMSSEAWLQIDEEELCQRIETIQWIRKIVLSVGLFPFVGSFHRSVEACSLGKESCSLKSQICREQY